MEQPIVNQDDSFAYEHKVIKGLLKLDLPLEADYKGSSLPFHVVNAANFRDIHFPELKAQGVLSYVPMDLRDDGIYDLTFNEKDEEISVLFETQSNLTKLINKDIDQNLILNHCPEKAEEKYFLMPYTLVMLNDNDRKKTYFRLIPALSMIPEEKSINFTLEYEKRLEMDVKMVRNKLDFKYSLTPEIRKIKKKRAKLQVKASSLDERILQNQESMMANQELIIEYTSQIELVLEKQDYSEQYLKDHLGSDWEKISSAYQEMKAGTIKKKQFAFKLVKTFGPKIVKKIATGGLL